MDHNAVVDLALAIGMFERNRDQALALAVMTATLATIIAAICLSGPALLCAFAGIPQTLWVEACVRPLALREFHRHPESPLSFTGVYWRRLRWHASDSPL